MRTLARFATALALAAGLAAQDLPLPSGAPLATVDLAAREGVELVGGAWRFREARLVEVEFQRAGPDRKPTGAPGATLDLEPRAGARGFDDVAWEVLDPTTLHARRGGGRVCGAWYRFACVVPERVGGHATAGSTLVFEIVVDDYAEVWVDGALPRRIGQSGGALAAGWNAPNRCVVAREVRPGQRLELAVFAANGPLSDPPANYVWIRRALLDFYASSPAPLPRIERLDPRLDEVLAPDAEVETVAAGFAWLEGPCWLPDRECLLFSDIPNNRIWEWRDQQGERVFLQPSGYSGGVPFRGREPGSNGLALDRDGRLLICQHGDRRLVRRETDGRLTVLADRFRGRRLNSPNDVACAPDGTLWFTDPPFGLPGAFGDPARELEFSGVYRLRPGGELELSTDELPAPNGVALSPDARTLYVSNADRARPVWLAYPLGEDGALGAARVLLDATPWIDAWPGLPDGFAVDARGNVFAAGPGGVYVIAADGVHLGTIRTGVATANCCLAGDDTLFVTAATSVLRVRLRRALRVGSRRAS